MKRWLGQLICLAGLALLSGTLARGQSPAFLAVVDVPNGITTNHLVVELLAGFGNTSNSTVYATAEFTPSSNATLIAVVGNNNTTGGSVRSELGVTNSGTTALTWWLAAGVGNTTDRLRTAAYVTQLPQGMAPFAMKVHHWYASTCLGASVHIIQVTGADQTLAYGTNAVVQTATRFVSNTLGMYAAFASPPDSGGHNTVLGVFGDNVNSAADNAPDFGLVELLETSHATDAYGQMTAYFTNATTATIGVTNADTTSRDWNAIALEIKAGTSGN